MITATELKENLGKYIDYVSEDNEVIVTKNGKKAIRITPYISEIERYFAVKERALDYQYGGKKVSYEDPFDIHFHKVGLDTPDVIQPDLLIACDFEENLNEKGRYMGTPSLCIEILSASTRSKDMVDKLNTFMLSGVIEFWIVEPKNQTVMIYSFEDFNLKDYYTYRQEEILVSQAFPGLEIAVSEIFAR